MRPNPRPRDDQMARLLTDPSPQGVPGASPTRAFAGRSAHSNVHFGTDSEPEQRPNKPVAGRRAQSTVFEDNAAPLAPVAPPGSYVGHGPSAEPQVPFNSHAGRITSSQPMRENIEHNDAKTNEQAA